MMTFFPPDAPGTDAVELRDCPEMTRRAVWIDLFEPTREEETALEAALGINVPTREEMRSIEPSSRLQRRGDSGLLVMTSSVLTHAETSRPETSAVTFILGPEDRLITVRYAEPSAFRAFRASRDAEPGAFPTGRETLGGLIDAIVERLAEVLENVGADLDRLSGEIFQYPACVPAVDADPGLPTSRPRKTTTTPPRDFTPVLGRLGRSSDVISRARESLVGFGRLVAFYSETQKEVAATAGAENADAKAARHHLRTVAGDLTSLGDHASFLSSKVAFLLDATLGLISNEQNRIINVLSVVAVVFGPPTLIAGIYGMNFQFMPELKWPLGYPFALALMVASAVLPYWYFKRRGWL